MSIPGNISCYFDGCSNPVVGQCPGFEKPCGLFFCKEHKKNGLCFHSAAEKDAKAIYDDYLATAIKIRQNVGCGMGTIRILISLVLGLGAVVVGMICLLGGLTSLTSSDSSNFTGFLLLAILVAVPVSLYYFIYKGRAKINSKNGLKKAMELEGTKPGFVQFYEMWDQRKTQEEIRSMLSNSVYVSFTTVDSMFNNDKKNDE